MRSHQALRGISRAHDCRAQLIWGSQEFEGIKEKIESLELQLDRLKQNITTTTIDEDPEETGRRTELTRCVLQWLAPLALPDGRRSALKEIEERSLELLKRGRVARFVGKAGDSEKVAGLIERLREAIINYQVSENCSVASSMAHRRIDIATTSDLRRNHQAHCENLPVCHRP